MFEILNKILNRKSPVIQELKGLEGFLKNQHWNNRVTIDEAKRNLEESLVEIDRYKIKPVNNMKSVADITSGRSKGFQITHEGHILTAAHCVNGNGWNTKIITRQGRHYPLQKVCLYDNRYDIALIKVYIEEDSAPRVYPFYNGITKLYTPCVCLRLEDEDVKINGCMSLGQIKSVRYQDSDEKISIKEEPLMFSGNIKPGDSGSPIVTSDGKLIGIATGYDKGIISGPHINKALELISRYIAQEKNII